MSQTRTASFVESASNVGAGFTISLLGNAFIIPAVGLHGLTFGQNMIVTSFFTVLSLARSYVLRRVFNFVRWGNK